MVKNNALAELAERLKPKGNKHLYFMIGYEDLDKIQRIIAELAKVKLNGVGWPARIELADAYDKCRAIAKEGG